MKQEEIDKLKIILSKRHFKWGEKSISYLISIIDKIRTGKLKSTDWIPQLENIVSFETMLWDLGLECFIADS